MQFLITKVYTVLTSKKEFLNILPVRLLRLISGMDGPILTELQLADDMRNNLGYFIQTNFAPVRYPRLLLSRR